MYHQSIVYIRKDLLDSLTEAVDFLNICRSRFIEALLIKYSNKNKAGRKNLKMLRNKYIRIHIGKI